MEVSVEQARQFRLRSHHLDSFYPEAELIAAVGVCGMQNSPPGAWEAAVYNRIAGVSQTTLRQLLEEEKQLVQAWSFRGTPVIFPVMESAVFLSALAAQAEEAWLYTRGIQLALDYLQMSFDELLAILLKVIVQLDDVVLSGKTTLDQTLADWMLPLLPAAKRELWNHPSMYGNPTVQTVGGAVVSFLLRPCSLLGLVVFAKRQGSRPSFTSYQRWLGRPLVESNTPQHHLVRKYLHCYGPATVAGFSEWLGCSPEQAQRLWQSAAEDMEPVTVQGKIRCILKTDKNRLTDCPPAERKLHLLSSHDPYLGLTDREMILDNKARQRKIWQTVSNPGAVLWQGEVVGLWKGLKQGKKLNVEIALWNKTDIPKSDLQEAVETYADFQEVRINRLTMEVMK